MREIKFRAWDKENNELYTPTYEAYRENLEYLVIGMSGDLTMNKNGDMLHESMFPNRFKLMQYTGLKDKNGKEIYEGDIVKLTYPVMPEWAEQKRVVEWLDNKCKFSICVGDAREVKEIIGNIYENKELLSGN